MRKNFVYLILAAIAVAVTVFAFRDGSETGLSDGKRVSGSVIEMDLTQAMVDGPYVVVLRADDGAEEIVHIPSMGIMLCEARDSIINPSELKVGDRVEAQGTLASDGTIVPCESPKHYVRRASN